jgi:hypothetical protein
VWLQSAASFLGFSVPQLEEALQAAAQGGSYWALFQASAYAASRQLLCPFCSSIYRNWWTLSEGLQFLGESTPLLEATGAAAYADYEVGMARIHGTCKPGF